MTITVRLDADTQRALARAAKQKGLSKSELVRQCLHEYLGQKGDARLAWELGKDVFGKYGSGRSDLAKEAKRIVREKIHAKKGRR
jgi:hypothetical protein